MNYRKTRQQQDRELGKSKKKSYFTSLPELKQCHAKLFSKYPSSSIIQRDIANGKFILIEALYRERLDHTAEQTKANLAKILLRLKSIYIGDEEPWEICKIG